MNIEHISISRYSTFTECPQKYKFKYHLKIESPEVSPFYFEYGKIVHKIAEEYVRNKGNKTLNEVCSSVLHGEVEIEKGVKAASLPQDYKARLPSHLRSIDKITKDIGFDGELELPFKLDLDKPNQKMISGVIDRLISRSDKIFIIDYKTTKPGKFRKNTSTIRYDLQLRAYAWAVQEIYKVDIDKIRASLYYLEGSNLIATKFTQASVDSAAQELKEGYDIIKNTDPNRVRGTTGFHCSRCEYKTICPWR